MKIESQVPKVPVQEKGIHQGKEKELSKTESDKSSALKKAATDQFAVNKLKAKIETEPDIDLKKVKELRDKIKKGEYKVDNEALAEKILKDSLLEDLS